MNVFPVIVLVACVLRRYPVHTDHAGLACDIFASLFVGFGISLISLGAGIGVILGIVCVVDLFLFTQQRRRTFMGTEIIAVIPSVLLAILAVYLAAHAANHSSYTWPAAAVFVGTALRGVTPMRLLLHAERPPTKQHYDDHTA